MNELVQGFDLEKKKGAYFLRDGVEFHLGLIQELRVDHRRGAFHAVDCDTLATVFQRVVYAGRRREINAKMGEIGVGSSTN
jgi:hypothetical protein